MGALLGAGQAVSVRSRPEVAIVSCCARPAPASRCCEARPGRGGTPGCRRGPPQPPSSDAWQHLSRLGERRERTQSAGPAPFPPLWHLQLAHGFVVFGFRLRDFNQPALLLGGRKSELYFSHWPEQKTEASAGVWEWFMG